MLTANLVCSVFWERGWSLLWAQIHTELHFLFYSKQTAVWNRRVSWAAPISWHSLLKRSVLRVLHLTKLTVFIIVFKVSCNSEGSIFYARACLWIMQWRGIAFGAFLYNSCNKTWLRTQHGWSPVCAYPTEIAPVKIFRFKEFCNFCITSSPFVDCSRGWQNKNSFFRSSSKQTLQKPGFVSRTGRQWTHQVEY